jgi:hypothetical protein
MRGPCGVSKRGIGGWPAGSPAWRSCGWQHRVGLDYSIWLVGGLRSSLDALLGRLPGGAPPAQLPDRAGPERGVQRRRSPGAAARECRPAPPDQQGPRDSPVSKNSATITPAPAASINACCSCRARDVTDPASPQSTPARKREPQHSPCTLPRTAAELLRPRRQHVPTRTIRHETCPPPPQKPSPAAAQP